MLKPGGPVDKAVREPLEQTAAIATGTAPVDTGFLRNNRSIDIDVSGTHAKGTLTYHAPYAIFVLKGTGVHGPTGTPIRPKTSQYMVFRGRDGRLVYAKETQGQSAQPFLQNAFRAASPWPVTIH
jgi:hypothetical protein